MLSATLQDRTPFFLTDLHSPNPDIRAASQAKIQNFLQERPSFFRAYLLEEPGLLGNKIHEFNKYKDNTALVRSITTLFFHSAGSLEQHQFIESHIKHESFSFENFVESLPEDLLSLNLAGFKDFEDSHIEAITKKCSKLTRINLPLDAYVTDTGLIAIATNCASLEQLSYLQSSEITDIGIEKLSAQCLNLKELDIRGCSRVSEQAIAEVKKRTPQIDIFK